MDDNGTSLFASMGKLSLPAAALATIAAGMDEAAGGQCDNPNISAGWTYFGQFLSHDVSTSGQPAWRSPALNLDSLYGQGPPLSPDLYMSRDPTHSLYGIFKVATSPGQPHWLDLHRTAAGAAVIADSRNDQTVMLGQVHLGLQLFHNRICFEMADQDPGLLPSPRFEEARKLVRFHFQWLVVHRFLPMILEDGYWISFWNGGAPAFTLFDTVHSLHVPVEFSLAAYRFGHSMVRPTYMLNESPSFDGPLPVESCIAEVTLRGGRRLRDEWMVQWNLFLPTQSAIPQASRLIDPALAPSLHCTADHSGVLIDLPLVTLTQGNGNLPSGQAVAGSLGLAPPRAGSDPLWWYVLFEAQQQAGGRRLGAVGSRIVAEVVAGLLLTDPESFPRMDPTWDPSKSPVPVADAAFNLIDVFAFGGLPVSE